MPYKYDVEKTLLQQLLTYPDLMGKLNVKSDHFYHKNFEIAFETMSEMRKKGEKINWVTWGSRFYDRGGMVSEVSAVIDVDFISYVYAEVNLKILAEELAKRRIMKKYGELSSAPLEFIQEVKKLELEFIENKPATIGEEFDKYKIETDERREKRKEGKPICLATGFKFIDERIGLEKGNLVVLAAKTNVGKSAFALNIAVNSAMFGSRVLFVSSEMTIGRLMDRVCAQLTGVSATRFKYANADLSMPLVENELKEIGDKIKFLYLPQGTSEEICRIAQRESQLHNIDLIVVDYIQYLKDAKGNSETESTRVGNITRNLKGLAGEIGCVVLALSQVNREAKGRPALHNLRDSGCIEQDADVVLILHRENKDDVVAELVAAKTRDGESGQEIRLKFKPELTKFYE